MRSRNIKPDFFIDEDLSELPFETRLLFIGLWCAADREGRVEDRPKRLKAQVFPFDNVNIDKMLAQLQKSGHVIRYTTEGVNVVQVKNFAKHQAPHHTERASVLPCFNGEAPESNGEAPEIHASGTVEIPLIPDSCSLIPDSGLVSTKRAGSTGRPALDTYSPEFEELWQAFPTYRRKGKGAAWAAYRKRQPSQTLHDRMVESLKAQVSAFAVTGKSWEFFPMATTWINQARWDDESAMPPVMHPQTNQAAITPRPMSGPGSQTIAPLREIPDDEKPTMRLRDAVEQARKGGC